MYLVISTTETKDALSRISINTSEGLDVVARITVVTLLSLSDLPRFPEPESHENHEIMYVLCV